MPLFFKPFSFLAFHQPKLHPSSRIWERQCSKLYFLDGLLILSCSPCVFVFPGAGCAHRRKRENTQSRLQPLITTPASAFNIYSIDFKRLSRGLVELLELCERESRKCKLKSVKEESLIMDPAKPAKKCPRREFKIWILQKTSFDNQLLISQSFLFDPSSKLARSTRVELRNTLWIIQRRFSIRFSIYLMRS